MRRLACLAAGLVAALACATTDARWLPLPAGDPRPGALLAAWAEAAEQRRALRGRARLAVDAGDGDVRLRGRQLIALERPKQRRYTAEDQKDEFAGDTGLDQVVALQDAEIVWGGG